MKRSCWTFCLIRQFCRPWKTFGGLETLISYGVSSPLNPDIAGSLKIVDAFIEKLPAEHVQFLKTLSPCFSFGDIFFAHAGVRPGLGLAVQSVADLMWIRDEFLEHDELFEKLIVHGHTPVKTPDVRLNRINIDTGAYATGRLDLCVLRGRPLCFLVSVTLQRFSPTTAVDIHETDSGR